MQTVALITGAADGIGEAFAHTFAEKGHDVVLIDREHRPLRLLANELMKRHMIHASVLVKDLSQPESPAAIANDLRSKNIAVKFLVNCPGSAKDGLFHQTAWYDQESTLMRNTLSITKLTRLMLPQMLARKDGFVLNITSAALEPTTGKAVESASQAFLLSFTQSLSQELNEAGVGVSCVYAGTSETISLRDVAAAGYEGSMDGETIIEPASWKQRKRDAKQRILSRLFSRFDEREPKRSPAGYQRFAGGVM